MTGWLTRWRRRRRVDREIDEELAFHIEAATRDLVRTGVPADDARRRVLADFGCVEPIRTHAREATRARWLDDLRADVSYGIRALGRQPGFAVVAILTLTLGIGANTAVFSMVNAVLLRPLPVDEPERLVLFTDDVSQGTVTSRPFRGGTWILFSTETYEFLRSQPSPFASIAAFESGAYTGSLRIPGAGDESGERDDEVEASFVSSNYFETLGARAALGRTLGPADDSPEAGPVAVASDPFWRRRLAADPAVIGRTLVIDDEAVTIVGVMPASFFGVRVSAAPDVWIPLGHRSAAIRERTDYYWLSLIGRLAPGQTMRAAETAVTASLRQFLASGQPGALDDATRHRIDSVRIAMADGSRGISVTRRDAARLLLLLFSAVSLILLIACANVGTLLLVRAASREREVAVRRALGAGRGRLVRQWLTESALLGLVGASCGAAAAWVLAPRLLATFVPAGVPFAATIDGVVFAFTAGTTFVACLLFGLAPSVSAGRVDPVRSLRLSGRSPARRRALGLAEPFVVAQVAMSLVLVLAATLLVRTLVNLQQYPFGFDQEHVLLVGINPRSAGYRSETVGPLYRQIHDRLASLPGVERVSFARYSPFSGSRSSSSATVEGQPSDSGENVSLETILVGPHYPQTIGMPVIAGRALTLDDDKAAPRVAMVNEAFAKRFFPAASPIGRRFAIGGAPLTHPDRSYEIVGVLEDAHFRNAREAVPPSVFLSMLQEPTARILDCEFEIRTRTEDPAIATLIGDAIRSVDGRLRAGSIRSLRTQVLSTFGPERTAAAFITAFAALALLVAAVGLYGIVAHGLARRTSEIGIRVALGAARVDVVRLIARETLVRLCLGLAVGYALAWTFGYLLAAQLFGVTPTDAVSALIAAFVLSAVVALTTIRPLRRAMRVDPIVALRAE